MSRIGPTRVILCAVLVPGFSIEQRQDWQFVNHDAFNRCHRLLLHVDIRGPFIEVKGCIGRCTAPTFGIPRTMGVKHVVEGLIRSCRRVCPADSQVKLVILQIALICTKLQ